MFNQHQESTHIEDLKKRKFDLKLYFQLDTNKIGIFPSKKIIIIYLILTEKIHLKIFIKIKELSQNHNIINNLNKYQNKKIKKFCNTNNDQIPVNFLYFR